jgi:hypothetical protein
MNTFTFNSEDIFEEIEGDPENVIMKFPPEILEVTGWKEGDTLDITLENGSIVVKKV